MNLGEPPVDTPSPTPADEERIDPLIPAGSHEIVTIRRHPFGLVTLYLQTIIGLVVAFGLIFWTLPTLLNGVDGMRTANITSVLALVAILIGTAAAVFLIIATALYRQNRWVITDDSITQVLRIGIFRTQTSGLSMANIEDVSSERIGIFAVLFGFGTLKVETAGERSNFHFYYCPTPDVYAKILLDARERFIEQDPIAAERANDLLNVPRTKPTR
ncbi:PH domain-containing protein [Candidatus Saccharibacteria bacterium]|nr:PH domain-containing protein [Candidatus Saccharibacteria bacterium]